MYASRLTIENAISAEPSRRAGPAAPLLEVDAAEFSECFGRRPFLIRHHLADHPLFSLPRLAKLSRSLPPENVEYNAANIPISMNPHLTPSNGLSAEQTISRIAECQSWLALKYIELDAEYGDLLHRCLAEVRVHSEALRPGMRFAQGFIFLSSPGAVTPYHMDPEHNFLLQIRGSKRVSMFSPLDRTVLSDEELERFYTGAHRNMTFKTECQDRAWHYELAAGRGLHFPVTAPHYVENGPEVSVSFSITFRTPDLEPLSRAYVCNAWLRRVGVTPQPVGQSAWRDGMKSFACRVARRASRLVK